MEDPQLYCVHLLSHVGLHLVFLSHLSVLITDNYVYQRISESG